MKRNLMLLPIAGIAAIGVHSFVNSQVPAPSAQIVPRRLSRQILGTLGKQISLMQVDPLSFTDLNGQMFVAGKNVIASLGEDGKPTKSFSTPIANPSISPHSAGKLIVGDLTGKQISLFDTQSGRLSNLFKLNEVQVQDDGEGPSALLLSQGSFAGVASDGSHVFVAVQAGFSSSIFKVDPATKRVVGKAFATADDPSAMAFHDGSLFVLVGDGAQVRRFSPTLEKSHDHIDLPAPAGKGIGVRAGEIRLLTAARTKVATVNVGVSATSRTSISSNLDRVRLVVVPGLKLAGQPAASIEKRYAILITGDLAENMAGELFWNDTVWMYRTLIQCGYKPEDVFVLYGDGADFQTLNPAYKYPGVVTDFAATRENVNLVLDGLKNGNLARGIPKMDVNDSLFLWTFDHGGRVGTTSTLCLRGPDILSTEMCPKLNALPYAQRAIFMQQCFSGGFIDPLKNNKTYISTASKADEVAHVANNEKEVYQGKTYKHGEFNYWILQAMNKIPNNVALKPDANGDSFITGKEMHNWNVLKEDMSETPQQADLGGVGTTFRFKK